MTVTYLADPEVQAALERLIDLARSDTGQARRAANFLLAWWDGDTWGHFPITDLFGVDRAIAQSLIETAHQICPYSKASRGNIDVAIALA